jgi:alkylation response protein AidB-like acyl-CoA dehydrogenase
MTLGETSLLFLIAMSRIMRPESASCAELVAAKKLVSMISEAAGEAERERRLPSHVVRAIAEAGLVQMAIPKVYGGLESNLIDILRVIEEISYADASAGWCLMNYQTTAFVAPLMQPKWAEIIFDGPEPCVPAGVLAPTARGHFVKGGLLVSGRWSYASGCDNANWLLGAVAITDSSGEPQLDGQGVPQVLLPLFSRDQFNIHDTWRVAGLCASGSHDIEVEDALVPDGRWLTLASPLVVDTPLYRFPIVSTFPPAVASVSLGVARAAFDCFLELSEGKLPAGIKTPLRELASAQIDIARAEAQIDSARSYIYETVADLWQAMEQGEPATVDAKRRVRLAGVHAAAAAASAVDLLYNAAGASSIANTCPLQRHFRDVHVTTQHMHVNRTAFERMGRLRLTDVVDGLL